MNRHQDRMDTAQRDLQRAAIDIQYEFWEWACFTSQQAAEKATKSLLMFQGYSAWGHAITPMLRKLGEGFVPEEERSRNYWTHAISLSDIRTDLA